MKRRGFTLIELLVVIAIIAILAAILMPVFVAAKQRSQVARCLSNLRQLSTAFLLYCDDYSGKMPAVGWGTEPNWCGSNRKSPRQCIPEQGQIWRYTKNRGIYLCPVDRGRPAGAQTGSDRNYPLSYSMNDKLQKQVVDSLQMVRASKMMLLIHEDRDRINDGIFVTHRNRVQDFPDKIHYDGTTVAYIDAHARWGRSNELEQEMYAFWVPVGMAD